MGQVILITLIFGSIFTLIGSILAILLQRENKKVTSFLLAFASGSMLSIVFIDLFNELIEQANKINHGVIIALVLVVCFFAFIFFLHQLVDHCTHHSHQDCHVDENHQICHDRAHAHQFLTSMKEGENLFHAGIILFIAMCIHNFPEGISLGVTFKLQSVSGWTYAILIGIHNIIVGFSIAMPFLQGKMKKKNILLISFVSTIPFLIGSILGFYLGGLNQKLLLITISLSISAILYVVFTELLPQSYYLTKSKYIAIFLIIGIVLGAVLLLI